MGPWHRSKVFNILPAVLLLPVLCVGGGGRSCPHSGSSAPNQTPISKVHSGNYLHLNLLSVSFLSLAAFPHRLNLFYLANDVIQNCKRKNAIIFRDTFAEVLPEAATLVKDPSVCKSIERIFKIWEDRNVYPEETITALKEALSTTFKTQKQPKETQSKPPNKSWKKPQTLTNPKAALKSKIVAEFRSQSLIDELLLYKRSEDQIELKEKQLSTMRVDVCSTETLKCLKGTVGRCSASWQKKGNTVAGRGDVACSLPGATLMIICEGGLLKGVNSV
uniref:CID domain-containing protein n=1 Tax=Sphenodon punctatus TaxID=8508 RepID=A0A8D0G6J6_SPHPU